MLRVLPGSTACPAGYCAPRFCALYGGILPPWPSQLCSGMWAVAVSHDESLVVAASVGYKEKRKGLVLTVPLVRLLGGLQLP